MDQSLELLTFGEEAREFRNYRATFTLINLEIEGISREWLAELKDFNGNPFKSAPKEWIKFVEQGLDCVSLPDIDSGKTLLPEVTVFLPSEKQYLRKTRLTQGKFRETLLKRSSSCKVCGMNVMGLLVAIHIKPWSACDDEERLNF